MSEIVSGSASISDLCTRIGFYRSSPVRVGQITLDFLDDLMNNRVNLVDPTNPFIMLLESSAVHCALAVNESLLNMRRSYSGLAETDKDIYRHMTDKEYLGRFATPGSADFIFMFELQPLLAALIFDPVENCHKGIIPRDTYIQIDNYYFTLEYPIAIRRYPNDVLQITYDTSIASPLSTPSNNLIRYRTRRDSTGRWTLYFTLPIKQFRIETTSFPIQVTSVFNKTIQFEDKFVHARVFHKPTDNVGWVEIKTTHTDQVFDKNTPTAVLQVLDGSLNVSIPYIYNTLGLIDGSLRIDVYTSKGEITVNMGTYELGQFQARLRNIDSRRDDNVYTGVFANTNFLPISQDVLSGGKNSVTFAELKERVNNYAFGTASIPITTAQLDATGEANNFNIVRNSDSLTTRYVLGTRAIPDITVTDSTAVTQSGTAVQKLLSRANIGMVRFPAGVADLQASDNVIENNGRLTLLSGTTFKLNNGQATMMEGGDVTALKAQPITSLVTAVNSQTLAYTPYYYVLDLQDSLLNVRPYDLDHPEIDSLSFVRQNNTLGMVVNTGQYAVEKTAGGYRITIVTVSGSAFKSLNDNQVGVQLRLTDANGVGATINGVFVSREPDTDERIYRFDIQTSYDIDPEHNLEVINAFADSGVATNFFVGLTTKVDLLYTTISLTPNFVPDETDTLINKNQLPTGSVGNTHDKIDCFFGLFLKHLWARTRNFASGQNYQISPIDVPRLYEQDVYEIDGVTGTMLKFDGTGQPYYNKIHDQGDPVRDGSNNITYKYRAGIDPVLDAEGNPIIIDALSSKNEFDILVIDGVLMFATDPNYVTYRDQVAKLISNWITEDIIDVQSRLIELTEIFFYPEASLGVTQIVVNGTQIVYINSEQTLTIQVFGDQSVTEDTVVQASIEESISKYLDKALNQLKFTVNQLETELKDLLGNSVFGVTISGLGGDANYKSMSVSDQHNRLCVRRKLFANTDNSLTVKPATNVIFTRH